MGAMGRVVDQRFLEDPFAAPPKSPPATKTRTWFRVAGQLRRATRACTRRR